MKLYHYYIAGTLTPGRDGRLSTISLEELRDTINMLSPVYVDVISVFADVDNLLPGQHIYIQNVGWVICLSVC